MGRRTLRSGNCMSVCLSICHSVFEAATAIQPRFRVCSARLNESGGVKMYEWSLCCFCYLLPKMWQSGNNSHCLELTCLTRWRANILLLPKRCCNIGCFALAGIGFHADLSSSGAVFRKYFLNTNFITLIPLFFKYL